MQGVFKNPTRYVESQIAAFRRGRKMRGKYDPSLLNRAVAYTIGYINHSGTPLQLPLEARQRLPRQYQVPQPLLPLALQRVLR
jgi:hypothetical protein